ncbi:hypothetical protein TPL01_09160 [Sulfuriferula plumbiphila]|uniref:DUF2007 domain-containing protein n=1 Tax=Sulfuriferula plumbiphila TaxID=171865 RepID=A0A512L5L7_9PROT|nr:DUF2007 domain-containing protein [Sulfuriferula plumbiphila]BBP03451.1 hypothetical protein SFPGR_08730 [Sulfuriferula plumbiphila]GEP29778.1 hypothetical protein TPL01_09160 [Sulfuriferula plumbiphila]
MDESMEFVTVARSLDSSEMLILSALLEAEGIPSFVADVNINQTYSLLSIAAGGVRLQVPSEFSVAARQIIADVNSGLLALDDDDVGCSA